MTRTTPLLFGCFLVVCERFCFVCSLVCLVVLFVRLFVWIKIEGNDGVHNVPIVPHFVDAINDSRRACACVVSGNVHA
eukprot:m.205481 g.205481  ORF g.205481 m.205481 type:complete len:78 (+) comp18487_c1_seq5:3125-3358(+)